MAKAKTLTSLPSSRIQTPTYPSSRETQIARLRRPQSSRANRVGGPDPSVLCHMGPPRFVMRQVDAVDKRFCISSSSDSSNPILLLFCKKQVLESLMDKSQTIFRAYVFGRLRL